MEKLPIRSEEHEVLQTGSIHVAILPSCQSFTIVHFTCIDNDFNKVVKIRNTSEAVLRPQYSPYVPWSVYCLGELWPSYCLLCVSYISTFCLP